ncbi:hypothetical protein [Thiolapillus sp.]|uniref:hypothetical protein n=1 Tax=Thiolapillus sp. TaxID=2017437 RepID=UPI003AF578BB
MLIGVSSYGTGRLSANERRELQRTKKQKRQIEKALKRKEKALAETAALLVLSKKCHAIWGEAEEE